MNIPSIYINLEDDVSKITTRLARERSKQVVLVCPKRCWLFSDSINLRLLKKQTDMLGKDVSILTMDERGQQYAKDAGFQLKYFPKMRPAAGMSDIRPTDQPAVQEEVIPEPEPVHAAVPVQNPAPTLESLESPAKEVVDEDEDEVLEEPAPKNVEEYVAPAVAVKKPAVTKSAPVVLPNVSINDNIFPEGPLASEPEQKKEHRYGRIIMSLVGLSLIVIVAVVFIVLPKAEVVVYAKTEPITRDLEISLNGTAQDMDATSLILPAQKISQTLEADQEFQTQGKKPVGSKAVGSVTFYNFTKQPIKLKSSTTVLSVGGKNYTVVQDVISVPVTKYKNGTKDIDPASLLAPVDVTATQGGEEYNIPAGTRLEVANQVFGSKPQFLYAQSAKPFIGGNSRFISVISDQDINNAYASLNTSLVSQLRDSLKKDGIVLPDKAFAVETVETSSSKPSGTETPVFTAHVKSTITGLGFREESLTQLVKKRIGQSLASNRTLEMNTDGMNYNLKTIDLKSQVGVISVHFEGRAVMDVNLDGVTKELAGKTKTQVNEILRSKAEVDKIEITLAPSWQSNFPLFPSKINVKVEK